MYYKKIKVGSSIIEFHNNWLGEETVIVNGQVLSKKSSILGAHHYFTIFEDGRVVPYILTTKIGALGQVLVDIRRDGVVVEENIHINFGTAQKTRNNEHKIAGIKNLKEYNIDEAELAFKKALEFDRNDPEIYFYLACCYSMEEKTREGFECLRLAVDNKLNDVETILNHEMLAYIRIQDEFEDFLNSNFTKYDDSQWSND